MNLDKLANWLQIIGNLGILAGLILVAMQINQNTQATIATASTDLTNQSMEYFALGMDNQVISRAILKESIGGELDDFEKAQLLQHQYLNFRIFENAYLQYRRGFYDEGEWDRYRRIIANRLTVDSYARQMWNDKLGLWTVEFEAEVSAIRDALSGTRP